jgi:serine/threonine protein kinase
VTALLDAHALDQLRIDWSDIKLADKPLGRGGFGAVYRGSWQGIKVAVKMLEGISTSAVGDLRREALMMSRVRHPGIAVVYGLAVADSEQQATDDGHAAVALVMK